MTATDNRYEIRQDLQELHSTRQSLQRQFNDIHHQNELELLVTRDMYTEEHTPHRKNPAVQPHSPNNTINDEETILQDTMDD